MLERDEHPRPDTTLEGLAALEPSFAKLGAASAGPNGETLDELALKRYPDVKAIQHVHHAGNSSGIVDGAAAVLLASADYVKRTGRNRARRVRAIATIGAEPVIMLTAPTPASERALKKAGMTASDIDLWEINEAFAAVVLKTIRRLKIDPERVNVNGGAIALGHPLGATGAMLLGTALDELERHRQSRPRSSRCASAAAWASPRSSSGSEDGFLPRCFTLALGGAPRRLRARPVPRAEEGDRLGVTITSRTTPCTDELDLQQGRQVVARLRTRPTTSTPTASIGMRSSSA